MKKAFTLLEMLVVIGIISVIVSMGFVSYSTAQKKARDSKIKSDLSAIQNAMEQYYSICGYVYPAPVAGKVPSSITCADPETTLMSVAPIDPKTGDRYIMNQTTTSDYSICAPNTPPLETESEASYCLENKQ